MEGERDLLLGQAAEVGHLERDALFSREFEERAADGVPGLFEGRLVAWIGVVGGEAGKQLVVGFGRTGALVTAPAATRAELVHRTVADHAHEPADKAATLGDE